jgi:hypothetical protein
MERGVLILNKEMLNQSLRKKNPGQRIGNKTSL